MSAQHVHVHTERGWLANDTAALHRLAPGAAVHTDSSPAATIEALVRMARCVASAPRGVQRRPAHADPLTSSPLAGTALPSRAGAAPPAATPARLCTREHLLARHPRSRSSDILLVGPSGFSLWAGLLSCGVKISAPSHADPRLEPH